MGAFAPAAQAFDNPRQAEWYVDALHLPEVWQTANGTGVTVAVIDSGVKADHPDLVGQLLLGKDFSGLPGGAETDPVGHGTKMASIIAGSGKGVSGHGVIGLAPGARVLPIKVNATDDAGTTISAPAFLKQIDQAIMYAVDQGAKVINLSLVVQSSDISPADAADLQKAVDYAISHGRLVVASAGNSGQEGNPITYPANAAGVAAIAAINQQGGSTNESEQGKYIALAAPGVDTVDACTGPTGYCDTHGTSDSAAMVSAMGAIVFSQHPDWTGNQVLRVLINTANKPNNGLMHDDGIGFGNASISKAIKFTGDPGPADANPLVQAGVSVTPPPTAWLPGTAPSASPSAAGSVQPSGTASGAAPNGASPAPATSSAKSAASSSSSGSSNLPLIIGGAVAAVLIVGGVIFFVARRKRSAAAPEEAEAPSYPLPAQQPPYSQGTPPPPPGYAPGTPPPSAQSPAPYQTPPPPAANPYREPQG
ncbi:S8 family serine peptidase [Kitasatospora sp. RB6PN24]|uniref:S8 family serine peptidase n=1 Tax=Kitasatospora humi TaxID=2893891 RepID=UPI001E47C757|nr:S8 family serine peptidase [Kitasatospora humi]MCC9306842.1 S8 family serine peptidase [Kitasatospora humi]